MARIYVAGPYTHGNVNRNVAEAMRVGALILDAGHAPFVPHLSHFWDISHPQDYDVWMVWCLEWVRQCQALVRITDGPSAGADREMALARELGLPILLRVSGRSDDRELRTWMREISKKGGRARDEPTTTRRSGHERRRV